MKLKETKCYCADCEVDRIGALCNTQIEDNYKLSLENYALKLQVEEMQKTLKWYEAEENHVVQYGSFNAMLPPKVMEDCGERARKTIQSLKEANGSNDSGN